MTPLEPMMSQQQVADFLLVTTRTIREYVARGVLPAYRINGTRTMRFRRTDVDALLQRVPVARHSEDA